jgi:YD repeat-containing protein
VNRTRYYPDGQIWKVVDAENHNTVVNTYNADGSLQKVADGKGNETTYTYNGFEGTKRTTYPGGTYEEPTYDSYRRVTQNRMRGGQKVQLAYDNLDRVKTKTVKDATDTTVNTITYKYDRAGRLLRTTDNIGTTRNTYDNAGRLTQVAYPGGRTVAYQYDAANNRTRLTYPDSTYVTYEYDALNRLRIVRNQAGTILAQYNFDWRSRRENLSYANGARIEYLYDVANRMISVDNIANSGSHEYAYGYDNVGNRTSMTVTNGGTEVHQYVYDGTYQVKDVDYPAGYGNGFTDTEFNYDAAGNRTTVIEPVVPPLTRVTASINTVPSVDSRTRTTTVAT